MFRGSRATRGGGTRPHNSIILLDDRVCAVVEGGGWQAIQGQLRPEVIKLSRDVLRTRHNKACLMGLPLKPVRSTSRLARSHEISSGC